MGILCKLFGHTIKEFSYGKFWGGTTDGIEREHGFYKWECERCGEPVSLYVHFPEHVLARNKTEKKPINRRKKR
jgi:hypothetical protein